MTAAEASTRRSAVRGESHGEWVVFGIDAGRLRMLSRFATEKECRGEARRLAGRGEAHLLMAARAGYAEFFVCRVVADDGRVKVSVFKPTVYGARRGVNRRRFAEKIGGIDDSIGIGTSRRQMEDLLDGDLGERLQAAVGYATGVRHTDKTYLMAYRYESRRWTLGEYDGRAAYFYGHVAASPLFRTQPAHVAFDRAIRHTSPAVALIHVDATGAYTLREFAVAYRADGVHHSRSVRRILRLDDCGVTDRQENAGGYLVHDRKVCESGFHAGRFFDDVIASRYAGHEGNLRLYDRTSSQLYETLGEDITRAFDDEPWRLTPPRGAGAKAVRT